MDTTKPLWWLNDKELGWVAGFLEGEGCFLHSINTVRRTRKGIEYAYHNTAVKIEVKHTDEDVIKHLKHLVGGNLSGPFVRQNPKHKSIWYWKTSGTKAIEIMRGIYDLMGYRRKEKINECLRKYEEQQEKAGSYSLEARLRRSQSLMGRVLSEESRQKTRDSLTGYKHTPEARANMGNSRRGKKRGPYKKRTLDDGKEE